MGWNRNIRELHPAEINGILCDRCTNARATENVNGDDLCGSCAYWVRSCMSEES